jgi:tRNA (uracil-5-)-methyltransferase
MDSTTKTPISKKRQNPGPRKFKNKRRKTTSATGKPEWPENGAEDVLLEDVRLLLQSSRVQVAEAAETQDPGSRLEGSAEGGPIAAEKDHEPKPEITIKVSELSSNGDGLAFHEESNSVLVVPFSVPGDVVKVKAYRHFEETSHSLTDLLEVIEPSPLRDDSLVRCRYFSKCSGCQLQMLPYENQLKHKKKIVEKAFRNFSSLDPSLVPEVQDTVSSPLQYGYRTKLTPHFDQPASFRAARRKGEKTLWPEVPPIGFMVKNTRKTMDIEDCVIGTDVVRLGMKSERASVAKNIDTYKKGRTILLREDTERYSKADKPSLAHLDTSDNLYGPIVESRDDHYDLKTCITNHNSTTREYVGDYVFSNPAGAFFQNNNSILAPFVKYIEDSILPKSGDAKISYLVDAYCGSGLFTITLSKLFARSVGIDIAHSSIDYARRNARANSIPEDRAHFTAADAAEIFRDIDFPPAETAVVIDPPRKGCDRNFLRQLLRFGPARVVYVSCNVHTQARDVGVLVAGMEGVGEGAYEVESLRGFDFFPQTGHVEGVAILRRKGSVEAASAQ